MVNLDSSEGGGGAAAGGGGALPESSTAVTSSAAAAKAGQDPSGTSNSNSQQASDAGPVKRTSSKGEMISAVNEEHARRTRDWPVTSAYDIGGKVICCALFDNQQRAGIIVDRRQNPGDGLYDYYVHYADLDKRLDEWVSVSRLSPYSADFAAPQEPLLSPRGGIGELLSPNSQARVTRKNKRMLEDTLHIQKGINELPAGDQPLEREHQEKTKVRNVQAVELGRYEMDAWYYSPFPGVGAGADKLYMCEFCLKYMRKKKTLLRHLAKCTQRHPPGDQIYRSDGQRDPTTPFGGASAAPGAAGGAAPGGTTPAAAAPAAPLAQFSPPISMFEVDGHTNKVYCQNLCLLSKLFLDHKTLYYDVDPFLFYILTEADEVEPGTHHVVGYFSKEKASAEEYNLACILTLPPHQRKGYGKFLIAFSYELSKKEGRVGTPERPLSDLGQVSYRSYWTRVLLDILREHKGNVSINDMVKLTAIKQDDIVQTLQGLNLVKWWRGQYVISLTPRVMEEHLKGSNGQKLMVRLVDPALLRWTPHPSLPVTKRRNG